ncbi:MAG TPA: excinuclease ABC subunit UvrA, partial [Bacteroidia bacterium]|nr:excinuclease ABC subunit UvrA [Bacteroidia bacterium]
MSSLNKEDDTIEVIGARAHNLKNIDVSIPRNKLVVITGLSGSGKSSLAFDTIYAEGQRRYIETFNSYARQFLGNLERPDVDKITGLSPVISIEQKTVSKNPRSTVGTITEIYDFLRLLFARAGEAYSYVTGEKMVRYSDEQIIDLIIEKHKGQKINILAPVVKGRKGHYRELFEQIRKSGFTKVRIDGEIRDIIAKMQVDRYKIHDIEIVVDRLEITSSVRQRLSQSVQTAMRQAKGTILVMEHTEKKNVKIKPQFFSRSLMCPTSGISYNEPAPNLFSFNSPYGACHKCNGLGVISEIDINKIVTNPKLSIKKGALSLLGDYKNTWIFKQLEAIGSTYDFTLDTPFEEIDDDAVNIILYGSEELFKVKTEGSSEGYSVAFEGIANFIIKQAEENPSPAMQRWVQGFTNKINCPECNGTRLRKDALYFKIDKKNIADLARLDIASLDLFFKDIEKRLTKNQQVISKEILKEIRARIGFLLEVGLDYVSLNLSSRSLSGGEAQRIRLATQIGSQLVGVLYILDEPSIGLHQRDNARLIEALKNLRDVGNSVIVVEHDKDIMLAADYVIDIGPGAGIHGGTIVAASGPKDLLKHPTLTTQYITGKKEISVPKTRRKGNGK